MSEVAHANVYEALAAFNAEFDGYVHKGGQVSGFASYTYAGERDIIAKLRPIMVKHGLFIVPAGVRDISRTERTRRNGGIDYVTAAIFAYRIGHASNTFIDVETIGEGVDSGDKGAYKAMTGAFKYALRQMACAETGDDPDDTPSEQYERHDPAPRQQAPKPKAALPAPKPPQGGLAERMGEMVPEARPAPAVPVFGDPMNLQGWAIRELAPQDEKDKVAKWTRFWQSFRAEMDRHGCVAADAGTLLGVARETMGDEGIYRVAQQAVKDALR